MQAPLEPLVIPEEVVDGRRCIVLRKWHLGSAGCWEITDYIDVQSGLLIRREQRSLTEPEQALTAVDRM
jgi:hypothetical protein